MNEVEKFAKAFELWEQGFRAEPEKYRTADEIAALGVSQLSMERAEYFAELLQSVPA